MTTDKLVDECHEIINDREKALRLLYLSKSAIRHNMAEDLPIDRCGHAAMMERPEEFNEALERWLKNLQ